MLLITCMNSHRFTRTSLAYRNHVQRSSKKSQESCEKKWKLMLLSTRVFLASKAHQQRYDSFFLVRDKLK